MADEKEYQYATPVEAFAAAERKIDEVRKTGGERLLLERYGLEDLPESIVGLERLRTLDLDYNRLTTVPAILRQLPVLQSLNLQDNKLARLPEEAFAGLQQLKHLALSRNGLTTLPEKIFTEVPQLESLILRDNNLTTLPLDVFARLSWLKRLLLNGNGLTSLPRSLEKCRRLKCCIFTAIPHWV
ncbi:MAG TPA: leucine-rich repeat domain-containing protein [Verrucomicrobiales bacterium]|nr:leucine-rich repeat domain-containing protein [Verrucomicrobiales bacterium]